MKQDKGDIIEKVSEDTEGEFERKSLPEKFSKTKIRSTSLLAEEIHETYEKKKRKMNREIMISNIKYASSNQIALMSSENLKASNIKKIRSSYSIYRTPKHERRELPEY